MVNPWWSWPIAPGGGREDGEGGKREKGQPSAPGEGRKMRTRDRRIRKFMKKIGKQNKVQRLFLAPLCTVEDLVNATEESEA